VSVQSESARESLWVQPKESCASQGSSFPISPCKPQKQDYIKFEDRFYFCAMLKEGMA